eukprot:3310706-Lingulodinium_polyedra.AAC.1
MPGWRDALKHVSREPCFKNWHARGRGPARAQGATAGAAALLGQGRRPALLSGSLRVPPPDTGTSQRKQRWARSEVSAQ